MTHRARILSCLLLWLTAALVAQPQPPAAGAAAGQPEQPRFRGGANLVRVDAYITADGEAVTDLTADDFEVLEDNVPQRIESFEFIRPRGPVADTERREPNTVAESRAMAAEAEARVFVLFMDIWHVQLEGSFRAQGPITRLLDRVIGQDDLVGVMTPEMSARNLTLARRMQTIDGILRDNWFWGQRNRVNSIDPREEALKFCYPDEGEHKGLAAEIILRRREAKTLEALDDLIVHLEGLREERKFVVLLSEGWLLPRSNQDLSRVVRQPGTRGPGSPPGGPTGVGVDPQGRLTTEKDLGGVSWESCERERSLLAFSDHEQQFQRLLQRANRANVSFYPLDARGLVAFDEPIGPRPPPPPSVDAAMLRARHDSLRTLAETTDGMAIVNTGDIDQALARMVADTSSYYLLGYYSTNTKLDGRFRRLTVRVKRPEVEVRARPGYLAPTEAEMASARVDALMNGAPPGHSTMPAGVASAFDRLAPARGRLPVRVHAAAGPAQIWITVELDIATFKAPEWEQGGRVGVRFEHERGDGPPAETTVTLSPGQRTFSVPAPEGLSLAPGRYVVRLQLTPQGGSIPLQTVAEVEVPGADTLLSQTGQVWRRGPATGREYEATADARFRRTEQLRFAVARLAADGVPSARLLGRDGQPIPVPVAISEQTDPAGGARLIVADLRLAPLAQGEYVVEVTLERGDQKESATYGFRLVP